AFRGVAARPVDQLLAVEERERSLVGCRAELVLPCLRDADPAAVEADVVVGRAERIVAVGNAALVAGAILLLAAGDQLRHVRDSTRIVSLGTLDRLQDKAVLRHPCSLRRPGAGRRIDSNL